MILGLALELVVVAIELVVVVVEPVVVVVLNALVLVQHVGVQELPEPQKSSWDVD